MAALLFVVSARAEEGEFTPPGALVVTEVGGMLFPEEQAKAAAAVAEWARTRGWSVVAPQEVAVVLQRAAAGQDPRTGVACGRALEQFEALKRWSTLLGAWGQIQARVTCAPEGVCQLDVAVRPGLGPFEPEPVLHLVGPYAPDAPRPEAIKAALAAARPGEYGAAGSTYGTGGLGIRGAGAQTARAPRRQAALEVNTRHEYPWEGKGVPDGAALAIVAERRGALLACFRSEHHAELLVETSGSGRVVRCMPRSVKDGAGSCACRAAQAGALAGPTRPQRAIVGMVLRPADVIGSSGALVTVGLVPRMEPYLDADGEERFRPVVSDPSIEDWWMPERDAIARCLARLSAPPPRIPVRLTYDQRGRVARVKLTSRGTLSAGVEACLSRALREVEAPCPAVAGATAEAEVVVRLERLLPDGGGGSRAR